jgi:ABC-2 type transport system ATP-binding protein
VAVDTPENLTSRLGGSNAMYVEVDGGGADASSALSTIAGVTSVSVSSTRGSITGYEVASTGRDVRRELASVVVARGWGLLELRPMRMSLEEIFLQVTTEEPAAEAAAEVAHE